jgi:hypothetical protein
MNLSWTTSKSSSAAITLERLRLLARLEIQQSDSSFDWKMPCNYSFLTSKGLIIYAAPFQVRWCSRGSVSNDTTSATSSNLKWSRLGLNYLFSYSSWCSCFGFQSEGFEEIWLGLVLRIDHNMLLHFKSGAMAVIVSSIRMGTNSSSSWANLIPSTSFC